MQYTKLGNTDIEVSKLCLGCMSFGRAGTMHGWTLDETDSEAVIKHAIDLGIKNLSSQAYAHIFSANFAADCVKNPCRAKARLRIFALSATKLCSKIRTHFL